MSTSANDGAVSIGQFEQLKQQLTKQIPDQHAAVTGELSLIRQQFAQLIQPVGAANSNVTACQRSTAVHRNSNAPALGSHEQIEHRHQRARISDDQISILAKDEVLNSVFSFVGIGEYYYVAGVCRNWRGRYVTLCSNHATEDEGRVVHKLYTPRASAVMTAARLQLALVNGLTIDALNQFTWTLADAVSKSSLEPTAVLTVARCHGLQWNTYLPYYAALRAQLDYLQWMHSCGCPIDVEYVGQAAVHSKDVATVTWLYKHFASSFTGELK
jgi:hypothetical protein